MVYAMPVSSSGSLIGSGAYLIIISAIVFVLLGSPQAKQSIKTTFAKSKAFWSGKATSAGLLPKIETEDASMSALNEKTQKENKRLDFEGFDLSIFNDKSSEKDE